MDHIDRGDGLHPDVPADLVPPPWAPLFSYPGVFGPYAARGSEIVPHSTSSRRATSTRWGDADPAGNSTLSDRILILYTPQDQRMIPHSEERRVRLEIRCPDPDHFRGVMLRSGSRTGFEVHVSSGQSPCRGVQCFSTSPCSEAHPVSCNVREYSSRVFGFAHSRRSR